MKTSRPTLTIREIGDLARARDQARSDPTIRVRRLEPQAISTVTVIRCVRCGKPGAERFDEFRSFHEDCRPKPAPPTLTLIMGDRRDEGRTSHLSRRDRRRVLDWLAEHGPATARMIGWALGLDQREVQLFMLGVEDERVQRVGKLVTARRGHPPAVWRVLVESEAAA